MADIKEKFGTTELKTEYAYNKHLEPQLKAEQMDVDAIGCKLYRMCLGYSKWLNETKLTPELVEKLFKGDIKGLVRFDGFFWMLGVDSTEYQKLITLADLARLTASKPILLA